jgi:uncharacterized membrane protein YebE (DUF533 family)
MNPEHLVDGVLRSVLGGRRRRSRRALRYLTRGSAGLLANPTTLLTAAGVAWGIFETLQNKGTEGSAPAVAASPGPGLGGASGTAPLPPLPNSGASPASQPADDAMRIVRLAISAAQADGSISAEERAAILQQATTAGVADVVEQALQQRMPLADIVRGVSDPAERATLYGLAFTVARADEQPGGAERIYLAQVANLLGLDPSTVQQIERDVAARIDAAGEPGDVRGA